MSTITLDALVPNESIPTRSRTFTPEIVKAVHDHLTGANGGEPVKNLGVGTFDSEGKARSALVTLNRLLIEQGASHSYSGTVRATDDGGQFRAIIINKPAKIVERKAKPASAPKPAPAKA